MQVLPLSLPIKTFPTTFLNSKSHIPIFDNLDNRPKHALPLRKTIVSGEVISINRNVSGNVLHSSSLLILFALGVLKNDAFVTNMLVSSSSTLRSDEFAK